MDKGKRIIAFIAAVIMAVPAPAALGAPAGLLRISPVRSSPVLKGLRFDPRDPLRLEFIIDTGDEKTVDRREAMKLIEYFLAGLTVPENDLWVNLSPYEADRIIPDKLGRTGLGEDMLEQDYLLKQLSASLTYPETPQGKAYWDDVNGQPAFQKVWITPGKAVVYAHKNAAFIIASSLKAMTQEDYLAMNDNRPAGPGPSINGPSDAFKARILPLIQKEVNRGQNFARLRQIYNSLVLAVWFKEKFRASLYKNYIDRNTVTGIDRVDPAVKEKIWRQYVAAFRKGAYAVTKKLKVESEKYPGARKIVKRRYFCGGLEGPDRKDVTTVETLRPGVTQLKDLASGDLMAAGGVTAPQETGVDDGFMADYSAGMMQESRQRLNDPKVASLYQSGPWPQKSKSGTYAVELKEYQGQSASAGGVSVFPDRGRSVKWVALPLGKDDLMAAAEVAAMTNEIVVRATVINPIIQRWSKRMQRQGAIQEPPLPFSRMQNWGDGDERLWADLVNLYRVSGTAVAGDVAHARGAGAASGVSRTPNSKPEILGPAPVWREISVITRLNALTNIARGLTLMYRAGCPYRDFKPQNILVDRGGRSELIDFAHAQLEPGLPLARAQAEDQLQVARYVALLMGLPQVGRNIVARGLSAAGRRKGATLAKEDGASSQDVLWQTIPGALSENEWRDSGLYRLAEFVRPVPDDLEAGSSQDLQLAVRNMAHVERVLKEALEYFSPSGAGPGRVADSEGPTGGLDFKEKGFTVDTRGDDLESLPAVRQSAAALSGHAWTGAVFKLNYLRPLSGVQSIDAFASQ